VVRAGVHADHPGLFQMNACPALLSIPEYDYWLVKVWEQTTHSVGHIGNIESKKRLLQTGNRLSKTNRQGEKHGRSNRRKDRALCRIGKLDKAPRRTGM
jgi:hypothetical protein